MIMKAHECKKCGKTVYGLCKCETKDLRKKTIQNILKMYKGEVIENI